VSSAFGTSREQITKTSEAAQRDSQYLLYTMKMTSEEADKFKQTVGGGITQFAAQAGEAGQFLSKFMAQVASMPENPFMNGDGPVQALSENGLGHLVTEMEGVVQKMKNAASS
jgi:hypothetical protein